MSKNTWMIRAGEGGHLIEEFARGVTLIDLRDFAQLVMDNYESFDSKGRALLPLVRIYRPTD